MWAAALNFLSVVLPLWLATGQKKASEISKKPIASGVTVSGVIYAIIAYFIIRYLAGKAAQNSAQENIQTGGGGSGYQNANALATRYFKAMFPSNQTWFPDGTDENALFELAELTTNYAAVFQAYRTLYNRSLTADLESELSGADYKKFLAILNS